MPCLVVAVDSYLASQRKDTVGVQNFTPLARVVQTKKFSRWEPKAKQKEEAELDIHRLRDDLRGMMDSHFEAVQSENDTLKQAIVEILGEVKSLKAKLGDSTS